MISGSGNPLISMARTAAGGEVTDFTGELANLGSRATTVHSGGLDEPSLFPPMVAPGQTLIRQARLGLWIIIASNIIFAVTDLRLAREALIGVLSLKLRQVATVILALRLLRVVRSETSAA